MRKTLFFVLMSMILNWSFAQITITGSQMPGPGTSYVVSNAATISSYELSGANVVWDFSSLTPLSQDTIVYETPTSSAIPFTYIATFNNPLDQAHKATTAREEAFSVPVPMITVSDVYFFYKLGSNDFRQVGMGANISGAPIPVTMDPTDRVFVLPLNYNDKDTSVSFFEASIPTIGYYSSEKTRYNHVDAYGTVITPYGSFEALRIKSTCIYNDSLYSQQIGMGFPNDREEVEYKWLALGYTMPIITVTAGALTTSVVYLDSLRNIGIEETWQKNNMIFPNPASNQLYVNNPTPEEDLWVEILNLNGQVALWEHIDRRTNNFPINISSLPQGLYTVILRNDHNRKVQKLVIE